MGFNSISISRKFILLSPNIVLNLLLNLSGKKKLVEYFTWVMVHPMFLINFATLCSKFLNTAGELRNTSRLPNYGRKAKLTICRKVSKTASKFISPFLQNNQNFVPKNCFFLEKLCSRQILVEMYKKMVVKKLFRTLLFRRSTSKTDVQNL